MKTYTDVITVATFAIMTPAVLLAIMLRPKPLRYVLRGSEAAVCFAFGLDALRRLVLIQRGDDPVYPGDILAIFNLVAISLVGLLLWSRVAQVGRHRARNRRAGKVGLKQLRQLEEQDRLNKPTVQD